MQVSIKDPNSEAQGCVIWMHGLGASSDDMEGLVAAMPKLPFLRHVFLDAPIRPVTINNNMRMPAWYDIFSLDGTRSEDREGVLQSAQWIHQVVEEQIQAGFLRQRIFLAGFSQGGAMALYTALQSAALLGGVICLSGYLPLANALKPTLNPKTPLFIASGEFDTIVTPKWTQLSVARLQEWGYHDLFYRTYPMEHSVCFQEMDDLSAFISNALGREGAV